MHDRLALEQVVRTGEMLLHQGCEDRASAARQPGVVQTLMVDGQVAVRLGQAAHTRRGQNITHAGRVVCVHVIHAHREDDVVTAAGQGEPGQQLVLAGTGTAPLSQNRQRVRRLRGTPIRQTLQMFGELIEPLETRRDHCLAQGITATQGKGQKIRKRRSLRGVHCAIVTRRRIPVYIAMTPSPSTLTLIRQACLRLHAQDDVLIAVRPLSAGTVLDSTGLTCLEPISAGHKVAARAIAQDDPVRRYGQIIGFASQAIAAGQHVHSHNLAFRPFERDPAIGSARRVSPQTRSGDRFMGIVRADGRVATRNYIGVLATVNCSASVAKFVAAHFTAQRLAAYPNVDGVVAITHGSGCGMDTSGEGMDVLRRTLAGYARHPNFVGRVIIGLGCEANQMDALFAAQQLQTSEQLQALVIQAEGGTRQTVEAAIAAIEAMLPAANAVRRQSVPASHLIVGLQCGGSDGVSGITANPALGAACDLLVAQGGTVILSETPEIYGAEHLLTARARSEAVAQRLLERIQWWEAYCARNQGSMDNNPSPGNKAGGLTTILEKSLGAVAKGGTSDLQAVYEYAEPVQERGLVFMDTPGYDPVSATGQVAGGAQLICFTTGRGSVYGCKPSPSIKLATNSRLYQRMREDMDINCGDILEGRCSVAEKGQEIFAAMLRVASGEPSLSEQHGMGQEEFVPWQLGAVM